MKRRSLPNVLPTNIRAYLPTYVCMSCRIEQLFGAVEKHDRCWLEITAHSARVRMPSLSFKM